MNRRLHYFACVCAVAVFGGAFVAAVGSLNACTTFGGGDDESSSSGGVDGSSVTPTGDASVDGAPPASGFVLSLDPPHVTADPGDKFDVKIKIVRATSYKGIIQFVISGGPLGVTTTNPAASDGDTSSFSIAFATGASAPPLGAASLTITASGPPDPTAPPPTSPPPASGGEQRLATLPLWIGSKLEPANGGAITLPAFAVNGIDVKAWGAGGGGWNAGAGGFAKARLLLAPNETVFVVVGTPGNLELGVLDGAGGGFSGIRRGDSTYLLIAGGGGGAGTTGAGGAGGGATGEVLSFGDERGQPGTATAGGAPGTDGKSGDLYSGGNGAHHPSQQEIAGGVPGGGKGGSFDNGGSGYRSGGGGGGYYGGGGGGVNGTYAGGGGGGSGFISDAGVNGVMKTGQGQLPPERLDPDYDDAGIAGKPNTSGRVVVRLPKPR